MKLEFLVPPTSTAFHYSMRVLTTGAQSLHALDLLPSKRRICRLPSGGVLPLTARVAAIVTFQDLEHL